MGATDDPNNTDKFVFWQHLANFLKDAYMASAMNICQQTIYLMEGSLAFPSATPQTPALSTSLIIFIKRSTTVVPVVCYLLISPKHSTLSITLY